MGFECFRRRGNVYSFEYSPENGDSEGFVEGRREIRRTVGEGVNVSFREREREKPCLRV